MLKWIESTGRSEDAAIEAALVKLGMDRDEVSVEVLGRAKSGFLGIGSCPAKVKVSYEAPDEPIPVVQQSAPSRPIAAQKVPEKRAKPVEKREPAAPQPTEPAVCASITVTDPGLEGDDRAEKIVAFLTGLMTHMGIEAAPRIELDDQGNYQVELVGSELGALIGRRGETLDAIQQLTGYAVNRGHSHRVRVHVDAEHYRAKREESLERLAQKVAGKVVKYRRNVTLEPMNAYERHVIHTALQEYQGVSTYSIGTEPNRRTVVAYGRGVSKEV